MEETLSYIEQVKRRQLEKLTEAGFTEKQAECLLEVFEEKSEWITLQQETLNKEVYINQIRYIPEIGNISQ